jgi:hypothetical protein
MNTVRLRKIWQEPAHELSEVTDEKEFCLRLTVAKTLYGNIDTTTDAIRVAHDTWLLNTHLPTSPDRDACYALLNHCWSNAGEQRVWEYMDNTFVLPLINTAKLEDIRVLRFSAKTNCARELIERKMNGLIMEHARYMKTRDDLTRLLRYARTDERLKERIRKIYDKQHVVPKMRRMRSKKKYEQLYGEVQSEYGKALLDIWYDRLFVQPQLKQATEREDIEDIIDEVHCDRYRQSIERHYDQRFVLDVLPTCSTPKDFASLPNPYYNNTPIQVSAHKNKVLVLDILASITSDSGFRTLYNLAIGEETKRMVAEAHLAWIRETYGVDLPVNILTDPPPYLVDHLRPLVLASV